MRMRVLACGSRYWTNWDAIARELQKLPPNTVLCHGGAHGADTIAGNIAQQLGLAVTIFPADWNTHGRAAGPIRNEQMLREFKPDLVLAFHEDPGLGKGTKHMVKIAREAGVEVRVFHE